MPEHLHPIFRLIESDPRYKLEAYQFVRDALSYAQDVLGMGKPAAVDEDGEPPPDAHLTGQQLCEAIRQFALDQYGLMSIVVLANWGLHSTSDFGEIVYNLIKIGLMKKSDSDRREDFNAVFEFEEAFRRGFKITMTE